MKEFVKKNIIALLALIIVVIIVAAVVIRNAGQVEYKGNLNNALVLLSNDKGEIAPAALKQMLQDKSKTIIPVDIRSEIEFSRGTVEGAVNIPAYDLLGKRSLKFFRKLGRENGQAVLFSTTQSEANGAYMLLKQVGIENVSILQGGFELYSRMPLADSVLNAKVPVWANEICRIDTAAMKAPKTDKAGTAGAPKQDKPKQTVAPVKKEASTGGGC